MQPTEAGGCLGGPRLDKRATESKPVSWVLPESLGQFQSPGSCLVFPWRWAVSWKMKSLLVLVYIMVIKRKLGHTRDIHLNCGRASVGSPSHCPLCIPHRLVLRRGPMNLNYSSLRLLQLLWIPGSSVGSRSTSANKPAKTLGHFYGIHRSV